MAITIRKCSTPISILCKPCETVLEKRKQPSMLDDLCHTDTDVDNSLRKRTRRCGTTGV
jgi:hypothetical protein